jgi:hypothetical protein
MLAFGCACTCFRHLRRALNKSKIYNNYNMFQFFLEKKVDIILFVYKYFVY